jgi:hypothetical protein
VAHGPVTSTYDIYICRLCIYCYLRLVYRTVVQTNWLFPNIFSRLYSKILKTGAVHHCIT